MRSALYKCPKDSRGCPLLELNKYIYHINVHSVRFKNVSLFTAGLLSEMILELRIGNFGAVYCGRHQCKIKPFLADIICEQSLTTNVIKKKPAYRRYWIFQCMWKVSPLPMKTVENWWKHVKTGQNGSKRSSWLLFLVFHLLNLYNPHIKLC